MKKIIKLTIISILFLGITSCLKPKHKVRIKNQYPATLKIRVGPNDYGSVAYGETSGYQSVPEGSNELGGDATGSISVTGKGKHNWTLTITSSGSFDIKEDQ